MKNAIIETMTGRLFKAKYDKLSFSPVRGTGMLKATIRKGRDTTIAHALSVTFD